MGRQYRAVLDKYYVGDLKETQDLSCTHYEKEGENDEFYSELKQEVNAYFQDNKVRVLYCVCRNGSSTIFMNEHVLLSPRLCAVEPTHFNFTVREVCCNHPGSGSQCLHGILWNRFVRSALHFTPLEYHACDKLAFETCVATCAVQSQVVCGHKTHAEHAGCAHICRGPWFLHG